MADDAAGIGHAAVKVLVDAVIAGGFVLLHGRSISGDRQTGNTSPRASAGPGQCYARIRRVWRSDGGLHMAGMTRMPTPEYKCDDVAVAIQGILQCHALMERWRYAENKKAGDLTMRSLLYVSSKSPQCLRV
jgi:hypothetical protein